MERSEVKALLDGIFEEEALLVGGLIAASSVEDKFVWRLMRNLDDLRQRYMKDLYAIERRSSRPRAESVTPHPAVQEFLARLRRDGRVSREGRLS